MWVVNSIQLSSLGECVYFYNVYGYLDESFHISLRNVDTGEIVSFYIDSYDATEALFESYHPYGCVVIDSASYEFRQIVLIVVDDWSLKCRKYVKSVEQVTLSPDDAIVHELWPEIVTPVIYSAVCGLVPDNSLLLFRRSVDAFAISCTLLHIMAYERLNWFGDCFYMFTSKQYSDNQFVGVDVYRVSFKDVSGVRALLGKFALVDKSILEKIDWVL